MKLSNQKRQKLIGYCFISGFLVLPFLEFLSTITLALLLFAGLFLKNKEGFLERLKKNKGIWFVVLYFLLSVISLSYTSDIAKTLDKIGKHSALILIPLGFLLINPSNELIEKAKKIFLYACIAFCIISLSFLVYHFIINNDISHWYNFVQASMYHKYMPEDAMLLNTALIFLLFGSYHKNLKLIVALLFLTVIILFGVRLGLIINLIVIGVYFLLNLKSLLNLRSLAIVVLGVIFSVVLIKVSPYASDKFYDSLEKMGMGTSSQVSEIGEEYHNISLRKKMWTSATELISQKPILGHGGGVEKNGLALIYAERNYNLPRFNAHSQPLSTLIQFGVVGLLVLLTIFYMLFGRAYRNRDWALALIVFVMFASMSTESYLELQEGTFIFAYFAH